MTTATRCQRAGDSACRPVRQKRFAAAVGFVLLGLLMLPARLPAAKPEEKPSEPPVDFNRQIRPLLADHCFKCHGPDAHQRQADLRLDLKEAVLGKAGLRDSGRIVQPGAPSKSELYRRITARDADERMPPPDAGLDLTAKEIELIRRWIEQGADWQEHWAFVPPRRPVLPQVQRGEWIRQPLDAFILARLEQERLAPSPEAPREVLIRRVSLDLTGLPPTPEEVEAFLSDPSPDAYERLVDRLLASPRYGERMALPWLDAARYADTNGYQTDGERTMWRWRDWVIEAFNANMPFDQFTIEQIAGDLLPQPTLEQRIATGFLRNHRGNAEGGIIPEEYLVEYVVDRVETTSTVWLGLTMGCARCHDHKFDPFSQHDFYRLFAFFHNVPESGKAVKYGNSPPFIRAPTRDQQRLLAALDAELAVASDRLRQLEPNIRQAMHEWERRLRRQRAEDGAIQWFPTKGLVGRVGFDADAALVADARRNRAGRPADSADAHDAKATEAASEQTAWRNETSWCGRVSERRWLDGDREFVAGPLRAAALFDGRRFVDVGPVGRFGFLDEFSLSAWIRPDDPNAGTIVSRMSDVPEGKGYALVLRNGHLHADLVVRWLDDAIRVRTRNRLAPGRWHHVAFTYDGSRRAAGLRLYVDGERQELDILLDELNQSFDSAEPLRIGAGGGPGARFRGAIDEVRIYDRVLNADEVGWLATAETIDLLASKKPEKRTPAEAGKLRAFFILHQAGDDLRAPFAHYEQLTDRRKALVDTFPTTMVMQEMPTPRPTYVLKRGQYDLPTERVEPGVPGALHPWPQGAPPNRLGLARWLVDPGNPLTARVIVNRIWQEHFGTGLVKTAEDFGTQGERPSHPQLLDFLATELVRSGWDLKALQRQIVTSATYRQSSRATPELINRDPENRLLARGARFRLPAEVIRDQALAISGLLVEQLGGPSVRPYQPPGLWKELSGQEYVPDRGPALYRRSLYTFWKRTAPPPSMSTFDAPSREFCVVRRSRTDTPLQALALMNETGWLECARFLAETALEQTGMTDQQRLQWVFRRATARLPSEAEQTILTGALDAYRRRFRDDPESAGKLIAVGEAPRCESFDVRELASWMVVSSLVLNLDEVVTRE